MDVPTNLAGGESSDRVSVVAGCRAGHASDIGTQPTAYKWKFKGKG
jgi:hypothetical protein